MAQVLFDVVHDLPFGALKALRVNTMKLVQWLSLVQWLDGSALSRSVIRWYSQRWLYDLLDPESLQILMTLPTKSITWADILMTCRVHRYSACDPWLPHMSSRASSNGPAQSRDAFTLWHAKSMGFPKEMSEQLALAAAQHFSELPESLLTFLPYQPCRLLEGSVQLV